jgi:hypothetical protein
MEFFHCLMLKIITKIYLYSTIWGQDQSPSGGKNCSQKLLCCMWRGERYSLNVTYRYFYLTELLGKINSCTIINCSHLSYICWQCLKRSTFWEAKSRLGNSVKSLIKFCLTVLKNNVRSQSKFCPWCCLHDVLTAVIPLCKIWALWILYCNTTFIMLQQLFCIHSIAYWKVCHL